MQTITFKTMSRELLEAELIRCNEIMTADGKRIGEAKEALAKMLAVLRMVERTFNVKKIDPFAAFVTIEKVRAVIEKAQTI